MSCMAISFSSIDLLSRCELTKYATADNEERTNDDQLSVLHSVHLSFVDWLR